MRAPQSNRAPWRGRAPAWTRLAVAIGPWLALVALLGTSRAAWAGALGVPGKPTDVQAMLAPPPGSAGAYALAPAPIARPPAEAPAEDPRDPEDPTADPGAESEAPLEPVPKLLGKKNVPPFWFDRRFDTHRTRALAFPPVFVDRRPTSAEHPEKFFHADLALTFGWYDRRNEKRRWVNPAAVFIGSYSKHKSTWFTLPLLMGYKRVGEQFNFGQFPLVWWWGNRHVKNFFVLPLHYQRKTPDGFTGVSGLIAWYGSKNLADNDPGNDRRHRVVFPAWFRFDRGFRRWDVAAPYIGGYNKAKGLKHRSVVPLFHWQSREHGNRTELWTTLWIDRKDKARRKRAWAVPPAMVFGIDNPQRRLVSATPLVWHHYDKLLERGTTVAGVVGVQNDPEQRNTWVAPLFFDFHDKRHGARRNFLLPLYHFHRGKERQWRFDSPLFGVRKGADGGFGADLWPALSSIRVDGERQHAVVAGGTFWWFKNQAAERNGLGVGPLFYSTRRGQDRHWGVPPALVFGGRKGTRRFQVLTPLAVHVRDEDPENPRNTWVFGPLYAQKRGDRGWQGGMVPAFLLADDERRRWAIAPPVFFAYIHDKKQNTKLTWHPLFVRYKSETASTTGAGLLFWDVKNEDDRHTVLAPLYYRRKVGDKRLTLTPVGGAYQREGHLTWLAGPVWGTKGPDRSGFGVLPVFFHQRRHTGENEGVTSVLPPLWIRDRRPSRDLDMWTPLLWRSAVRTGKPRKGLAVVPFYFRQRQPGGVDIDAGLPWFWSRDRTRHTHTLVAGPFFHRLTREKLVTGLAPVSLWIDSEKRRRLITLPLIFHDANKENGAHTTIALPLWFDRQQPNGRRAWMAFPFLLGVRGQHNFTRIGIGMPGFLDVHRLSKNMRFTGWAPFLFRYQKCGFQLEDADECRYTLWGSFPLFMYGKDGMGRRSHSTLGLYWWDKSPEGGTKLFTWIGGGEYVPGKRLRWYAGPLYRDVTGKTKTTALFPLYYRRKWRAKDKSTTVVLPPLFIGQRKQDRRWYEAGLLFWQFRKPHRIATHVVPPVFGYVYTYAQRRTTWVVPLFVRDNHWGEDASATVIPGALFVQRRNRDKNTAVQFPLLWHFKRGEKRTTVGALLWYDVRRRGNTTQVVPGLYARRKTATRTTNVVGPGLAWWHHSNLPGSDDRGWNAILGLFGGGREAGQKYMSLFGARIKLGGKAEGTVTTTADAEPTQQEKDLARNERIEARLTAGAL